MTKELLTGSAVAHTAKDDYALNLWRKHGLGDHPSIQKIEPVAKQLLNNPATFLEGAAVVLGRRVDAKEKNICALIFLSCADKKFGALLLVGEIEAAGGNMTD